MDNTHSNNRLSTPTVVRRDEGEHRHFLNHLATTKVPATDGGSMSVIEFVAGRGFGPPLHVHEDEDEMMVILEGEVAVRHGDAEEIAHPGDMVWLPHGEPHIFQVVSHEARMLTITASETAHPRFDQMIATLGTPIPSPELPDPVEIDPARVANVCAENGITVLGPPPAPLDAVPVG